MKCQAPRGLAVDPDSDSRVACRQQVTNEKILDGDWPGFRCNCDGFARTRLGTQKKFSLIL
jgi:hypothetical protein